MSVCIVRVTGDIVNNPASLQKFSHFISQKKGSKVIVASALPDIFRLVSEAIEQVHDEGFSTGRVKTGLHDTWERVGGSASSQGYNEQSKNLTNLLKGIHLTGDYSPALRDNVLSYSEILTSWLLGYKLQEAGFDITLRLPADLGLTVSDDYGNATFFSLGKSGWPASDENSLQIIPGSHGITAGGKVARTGKSAADYTAAFLASVLGADRLVLFGSTREFYAADRAIVQEARKIDRLTYAEASELAYFDHFSLHPRAVEPLIRQHIPIHYIHASNDEFEPETVINSENYVSERIIKSVASTSDISILRLNGPGVGLKPGILARITAKLSEASINIKSVITSQVSINILLERKSGPGAVKAAGEVGFTAVSEIELLDDVALLAIVGHGMQHNYGISATLFGAVARNNINVILSGSGASDLVSYLVVSQADKEKSVRAIYDAFFKK